MNSRQIATWRQIIIGKLIYVKKVPSPDQFAFFERTLPHTRLPAFSVVSIHHIRSYGATCTSIGAPPWPHGHGDRITIRSACSMQAINQLTFLFVDSKESNQLHVLLVARVRLMNTHYIYIYL